MIVYNISTRIDPEIEQEWLRWQKQVHIPEAIASGKFTEYRLYRLLDQDEEEGITYVTQFYAPDRMHYEQFLQDFDVMLREKALLKWGNKFIAFRTAMQIVN